MAETGRTRTTVLVVLAVIVVLAIAVWWVMSPVRRPGTSINGAPPQNTLPLTGGPVNGVSPSVAGAPNSTGTD